MKKRSVIGIILISFALTACSLGMPGGDASEREVVDLGCFDGSDTLAALCEDLTEEERLALENSPNQGTAALAVSVNALIDRASFMEYDVYVMAVGDDLMHQGVVRTGLQDDGSYNFDCLFDDIEPYLSRGDIKIINQENVFAGNEKGFSGYPLFNCPVEISDALCNVGFNVVLHASNHAVDQGIDGLVYCKEYWDEHHPEMMVVGVYGEEGRNDDIPLITSHDITFAVLNYTYSANSEYVQSGLENHLNLLHPYGGDRILDFNTLDPKVLDDIKRAEELADFVIVCPHWGVEYQTKENSFQDEAAREMIAAGADIIIGAHPHVVQPVEWIETENGNSGICYYSLGNYVSTQYDPICLLEGMAWVKIHVTKDGPYIVRDESGVLPMVLQYQSGPLRITGVIPVEEYNDDLAVIHGAQNRSGEIVYTSFFEDKSSEIFGDYILSVDEILDR